MSGFSRRGFLFGAVAMPAGMALPEALARELALPAPEAPKAGSLLIMPHEQRDAVMRLSDLRDGTAALVIVDNDGRVMSRMHVTEMEHSVCSPAINLSSPYGVRAPYTHYGPAEVTLRMRGYLE